MMAGRDDVPACRGQRNIRAGDSDVNGPKKQQRKLQAAEASLHQFVLLRVYILMAITGLGYLALTWSTVVLLGGFVTSLGKKDFWCLTTISMIQAARIFNDLGELVMLNFFELVLKVIFKALNNPNPSTVVLLYILLLPVILVLEIIYVFGSIICLALSLWRIGKRDYSNMDGDNTKANLMPALDIFYCLVICQGMLFIFWSVNAFTAISFVDSLHQACKFPEMWGSVSSWRYFSDTRGKCWRDLASIKNMSLITYAVGLLDSELQEDYISGARMLDVFIKQGVDVRSLILPSRTKIQKLIDTLGWRSSDREIRELAARIVAYLASDIHLAQFPGAIRCISSLLDTTRLLPGDRTTMQEFQRDGCRPRAGRVVEEEEACARRMGGLDGRTAPWCVPRLLRRRLGFPSSATLESIPNSEALHTILLCRDIHYILI